MTRREYLMLMAAAVVRKNPGASYRRFYQATAVISFCGVTIFSKRDVGGGYAVAEEIPQGEHTAVALQFAGGSWPAKAHGVNRLGYIKEQITERAGGQPVRAEYYGFMTSSAEKSFDQAKKSFADKSGKPVPYSATEGQAGAGVWNFSLSHLMMSSHLTFLDCGKLNTQVKAAMAADPEPVRSADRFGSAPTPNTFLNSLRLALRNSEQTTDHSLVYNGKAYRMHCSKQADGKLTRLNGLLEETGTGQHTPFKLWCERDDPNYLPVKIEYKAKPFLKLVFEAEQNWQGPSPAFLLNQETT